MGGFSNAAIARTPLRCVLRVARGVRKSSVCIRRGGWYTGGIR